MKSPQFSIADLVSSQHELLTRVLHINHVKAVIGSSMRGMQRFEWEVSYPSFMDKAVAIGGTPRLAEYDLLLWQTQRDARMVKELERLEMVWLGFCTGPFSNGLLRLRDSAYNVRFAKL